MVLLLYVDSFHCSQGGTCPPTGPRRFRDRSLRCYSNCRPPQPDKAMRELRFHFRIDGVNTFIGVRPRREVSQIREVSSVSETLGLCTPEKQYTDTRRRRNLLRVLTRMEFSGGWRNVVSFSERGP